MQMLVWNTDMLVCTCSSCCRAITTSECPAYDVPPRTVSNPAYAQITRAQDDGIYEIVD